MPNHRGDYTLAAKVLESKTPKKDMTIVEEFKSTPKIDKMVKSYKSFSISFQRLGSLCVLVKIVDNIVPSRNIKTTVNTEKEILNAIPDLVQRLTNNMSDQERDFYGNGVGTIEDIINEEPGAKEEGKYQYSKTAIVSKIIKNPFRDGTKSHGEFEKMSKHAIGKSHKDLIKMKLNAGALKTGWEKGFVVFE